MKKLLLVLLLLPAFCFGQLPVTDKIKTDNYTSYLCRGFEEPLFVSYVLYHGGGDCSRNGFHFKNDQNFELAGDKDYQGSGYDKGHMADAEDFAYDCTLDEETFRYYNCLPQTPNLNRGIWKVWETKLREESQKDSLLIICGGVWTNKHKGNMAIPVLCWKVVKNLRTKQIEHVMIFTNDMENCTMKEERLDELEKMLNLKLPI